MPNPSAVYLVAVVSRPPTSVAGPMPSSPPSRRRSSTTASSRTRATPSPSATRPPCWQSRCCFSWASSSASSPRSSVSGRSSHAPASAKRARSSSVSRALATRDSTAAVLPEILDVVRAEGRLRAGLDRTWQRRRQRARHRRHGRRGQAATAPAFVNVLRRMPGEEPARWVRLHMPGHVARARRDRLPRPDRGGPGRLRIDLGQPPIRLAGPRPNRDPTAGRRGRSDRPGARP